VAGFLNGLICLSGNFVGGRVIASFLRKVLRSVVTTVSAVETRASPGNLF
jgi:hypothetical protein